MKLQFWLRRSIFFVIICLPLILNANNQVIATVGSHNILLNEFEIRYEEYILSTGMKDTPRLRKSILNNMINELLLKYYDDNSSIANDPEYRKEIEWLRKDAILGFLKDQEVYAKITVTDQELRETFIRVNQKLAARHLYAPTKEEADNLYQLLQIGVSFETLAQQVFSDSILRNNGGYLGYFTWGDMDPSFEDAAFSIDVGEISQPVKTAYGYSIIKLEDRFSHPLLTETEYLNKKSQLERTLKIKKKKPYEKEFLKRIFDREKLFFFDGGLASLMDELKGTEVSKREFPNSEWGGINCAEYLEKTYGAAELLNKINQIPAYHRSKIVSVNELRNVIEGLLIQDVLLNLARAKGYDTNKAVLDKFRNLELNAFLRYKMNDITANASVPDSAVINYYYENLHIFSTENEINIQEIITDKKNTADSIMTLLSEGVPFGDLAEKYSLREWSAKNGGVMGFAPINRFGGLKDRLWNSEIGQILVPLTISDYYGIFKILGKNTSHPLDLSLVKDEVKNSLKLERKTKIVMDYLVELQKSVDISIDEGTLVSFKLVDQIL